MTLCKQWTAPMNTSHPSALEQNLASLSRGGGTGAMHVPRPARRWKTRVLVPAALLLSVSGLLAYAARDVLVPAIEVHVVPVVTRTLETDAGGGDQASAAAGSGATSPAIVQAPGWVEPDPFAVSVPALVEGVISEMLVLEGETVEAGQVVAKMIDADLALELEAANAAAIEREADVRRAETAVEQMKARVDVDRAEAAAGLDEVNRKRGLVAGGGISSGEFRKLELLLAGLNAKVAASESAVAEARAAVVQAQAALRSSQVVIRQAQLQLERTHIRAPQAGVVLTRYAKPGMRMSMNSTGSGINLEESGIVSLYDPAKLQVRADVPLADAAKVAIGTQVEITTEAIANTTFKGVVSRVVHEANIQRNTVQFKVRIENPSPLLKPEMLARVRFHGGSGAHTGAVEAGGSVTGGSLVSILPASILVNQKDGPAQVWIVEAGRGANVSHAVLRDVKLGSIDDNGDVVITSGINPGDRAIVDAPLDLRPGTRVRVIGEAEIAQR